MTPEYRIIDDNVYVPEHYHFHNSATKGYVKGSIKFLSGLIARKLRALSGDVASNLEAEIYALSGLIEDQYLALSGNVEKDIKKGLNNLIAGAPGALDTLKEISDYIAGEGGLSGLITALEANTDESLKYLSGQVSNQLAQISGTIENYKTSAVKQFNAFSGAVEDYKVEAAAKFNAFSGAIDAKKVDKDVVGSNKIVQDITYGVTKDGKVSWTKKLVSLQDGATDEFNGNFDLVTESEFAKAVTELKNRIAEKIDTAHFGKGDIVSDVKLERVDKNGNIIIAVDVFNAKTGTPPKTYRQEVVLADGLTAKLNGDKLVLGNIIKDALDDYIVENNTRVNKKVNTTQFGEGTVIQNVKLEAVNNKISVEQKAVNVATGFGESFNKKQEVVLEDGLTARNSKGKLVLGTEVSGALVKHIQHFNETISNLVGTAPETLDQLHEIAAYISGETGLSGFITNNLQRIDDISGALETRVPKNVIVKPQPGIGEIPEYAEDTADKRVLMQSVTFDQFAVENQKVTGWEIDLDNGNEIPVEIDVSKLVSGIASIDRAVVKPRTLADGSDRRVLMQSITFDQFTKDNNKVTGWEIDIDSGEEIAVPIDVSKVVKEIAEIDRAVVKARPEDDKVNGKTSPAAGRRALMQSITFEDFDVNNQYVNGWMVDLDNGSEIKVPVDVSDLVSKIASIDRAVVHEQTSGHPDTDGKRVLMQSITFDQFDKTNQKVTGWVVDLDNGTQIPIEIDVSKLVSEISSINQAVVPARVNDKLPDGQQSPTNGQRVLMQSVTFEKFTPTSPIITSHMVNLETGADVPVDINMAKLIEPLAKKYAAAVKPRPTTELGPDGKTLSLTAGKRVLLQSITFDKFPLVTGWMIDLDNGNEIPIEYNLGNQVNTYKEGLKTEFRNAFKAEFGAEVKKQPEASKLPENAAKTAEKRVLMQSITFDNFPEVTGWMVNLDNGEQIPVTFNLTNQVNGYKEELKKAFGAVVNKQPEKSKLPENAQDTAGLRVLMQSITYEGFNSNTNEITINGWMVDLDTGEQIAVPFKFNLVDQIGKAVDAIKANSKLKAALQTLAQAIM
jgi:hypothetical protein